MEHRKIKACVIGTMFLAMLMLPGILFPFVKDYVDTENYENRVYQEKPELSLSGLKEYPSLYEAYFNDYLPFKNPIVAFGKLSDIRVFGEVTSDSVLIGKDGWMFYKLANDKEDSLADYQGTNHYSEAQLQELLALFQSAREHLEKNGIDFILYLVPNKERVYSEYMPDSVKVINPQSRAELLGAYLKDHGESRVYYPLEEFKWAKDNWCQVYRKYDTHWNDIGAYMAAQMILQDMESNGEDQTFHKEEYLACEIENRGTFSGDLASMLNLQKYYDDDAFLKVKGYKDNVNIVMDYQNDHETVTHYVSDAAQTGEKLLIFRDSFGVHMAEYFAKNYTDVTLMDYRTEDASSALKEVQPKTVVIEMAERYTDYLFDLLKDLSE